MNTKKYRCDCRVATYVMLFGAELLGLVGKP
jgi:hypothetical protein